MLVECEHATVGGGAQYDGGWCTHLPILRHASLGQKIIYGVVQAWLVLQIRTDVHRSLWAKCALVNKELAVAGGKLMQCQCKPMVDLFGHVGELADANRVRQKMEMGWAVENVRRPLMRHIRTAENSVQSGGFDNDWWHEVILGMLGPEEVEHQHLQVFKCRLAERDG